MNDFPPVINVVLTSMNQNENCFTVLVWKSNTKFYQNTFFTLSITYKGRYYYPLVPYLL